MSKENGGQTFNILDAIFFLFLPIGHFYSGNECLLGVQERLLFQYFTINDLHILGSTDIHKAFKMSCVIKDKEMDFVIFNIVIVNKLLKSQI